MKKLLELIEIVNPTKLKGIEVLGKSDTLVDKLYHQLRKGEIKSDQDALKILYKDTKSKTALYQVKEKLYDKLIDSLFIIDPSEKTFTEYDFVYHDNLKQATVIEWLSRRGGQNNILILGNKIIKKAIKFNQADIVLRVAKILARKYVIIEGDEKKLEYYNDLSSKYQELSEINRLAEYYWYKISVRFNRKSVVVDDDLLARTQIYISDLESKLVPGLKCNTFAYYVLLKIRKCEILHDFEAVIKIVDENIQKLKDFHDSTGGIYNAFLNKKLTALITLRKYSEANNTAHKNLKFLREGQVTWFTLHDNIITLFLCEQKYSLALKAYLRSTKHSAFKFLTDTRKETYKVYRAYLQFYINIGLLEYPDEATSKKPLRYAKFSNEMHIFTHDKKGVNTTIIIAQFLLLFTEEKYREANDKIESVRSYTRKHLKLGETFRSRCFLKMLVKLVEADFHKAATIRKTKDLYAKLQNHPPDAKRLRSDVEIVPYEHLWEIILSRIDNSFRGVFKSKKIKQLDIKKE